jgi:translation initiation factor IF-2
MSDTDGKKTLGLRSGSRPGNVKQSFSHGRTKNVVVETKRKRVVVPKPGAANPKPAGSGPSVGNPSRRPAGISDVEMERRLKAVQAAKSREVEESARRAADEKAREEERERRRAEIEAKERQEKEREETLRLKAEEDARKAAEAEAAAQAAVAAPAAETTRAAPRQGQQPAPTPRKNEREREQRPSRGKGDDGRRSGKLTLNQALSGGEGGRQRSPVKRRWVVRSSAKRLCVPSTFPKLL